MSVADSFHPVVRTWFTRRFDAPTDAQTNGWPHTKSVVYRDGVPLAEDEAAAALSERRALVAAG